MKNLKLLVFMWAFLFSIGSMAQTTNQECSETVLIAAKKVLKMRDDFFSNSAKEISKKYFEEIEGYVKKCENSEFTLTTYKSKLNRIADIQKELEYLKKKG